MSHWAVCVFYIIITLITLITEKHPPAFLQVMSKHPTNLFDSYTFPIHSPALFPHQVTNPPSSHVKFATSSQLSSFPHLAILRDVLSSDQPTSERPHQSGTGLACRSKGCGWLADLSFAKRPPLGQRGGIGGFSRVPVRFLDIVAYKSQVRVDAIRDTSSWRRRRITECAVTRPCSRLPVSIFSFLA